MKPIKYCKRIIMDCETRTCLMNVKEKRKYFKSISSGYGSHESSIDFAKSEDEAGLLDGDLQRSHPVFLCDDMDKIQQKVSEGWQDTDQICKPLSAKEHTQTVPDSVSAMPWDVESTSVLEASFEDNCGLRCRSKHLNKFEFKIDETANDGLTYDDFKTALPVLDIGRNYTVDSCECTKSVRNTMSNYKDNGDNDTADKCQCTNSSHNRKLLNMNIINNHTVNNCQHTKSVYNIKLPVIDICNHESIAASCQCTKFVDNLSPLDMDTAINEMAKYCQHNISINATTLLDIDIGNQEIKQDCQQTQYAHNNTTLPEVELNSKTIQHTKCVHDTTLQDIDVGNQDDVENDQHSKLVHIRQLLDIDVGNHDIIDYSGHRHRRLLQYTDVVDGAADRLTVRDNEIQEMEIKVSNQPRLFSPKKKAQAPSVKNKEIIAEREINSVDSLLFNESQRTIYEIEKRKTKVLKIDEGTDFCKIQTVKYRYKEKVSRQHYMKSLKDDKMEVDGDIGLRPGDMFLKLNGTPLQDRKQKKVRKMFKNIKPGTDGNIQMELVFQRWETRHHDGEDRVFEVVYKLKLILEPETSDRSSSHSSIEPVDNTYTAKNFVFKVAQSIKEKTRQVQLKKGEIDQIKPRNSETRLIKALYVGVDEYVTVLDDGLPGLEVPTKSNQSQNHFTLQYFSGMDKSSEPLSQFIYCVRFGYQGRLGTCYLTTELPSHNELAFRESTTTRVTQPDDIDGTCFIMRAIGSEMLFESLLHRGYYISCEATQEESQSFVMLHKTKADVIDDKDLDNLKFELCRPSQTLEQTTGLHKFLRLFTSCSSRRSETYSFR